MFGYLRSIWRRVSYQNVPVVDHRLDQSWVALPSDSEIAIAEARSSRIQSELELLKGRSSSNLRAMIRQTLSGRQFPEGSLSSDLRMRIYKDIFTKHSTAWLEQVSSIIPESEKHWSQTKYEKNILGQMIDMADRNSPETLTQAGLSEVIYGVHFSLIQSLKQLGEVSEQQSRTLLEMILKTADEIITLWRETVRLSKAGVSREGRLPSLWEQEKDKPRPIPCAKFSEGDSDKIRKSYLTGERVHLLSEEEIKRRREFLEQHFVSRKR